MNREGVSDERDLRRDLVRTTHCIPERGIFEGPHTDGCSVYPWTLVVIKEEDRLPFT